MYKRNKISRAFVIVLGFVGVLAPCVALAQDSNYPAASQS